MNAPSPARPALLALDDAIAQILARVAAPDAARAEALSSFDALGRVLAEDVRSQIDVPPADNSEMDGYALRAADVAAPGTVLPVAQRIAAGSVGAPLASGHCGAHLHRRTGAARRGRDRHAGAVRCRRRRRAHRRAGLVGQSIRRRGEDVERGARVLAARHAADAAGARHGGVGRRRDVCAVARRPRVALFSTGDELAMPGEPLKPGAIYNSNRFTLRGLIESLGGVHDDLGIVPDKLDATRAAAEARSRDERPDRHLRRRVGRRGRSPEARGRAAKAGSTSGRSR